MPAANLAVANLDQRDRRLLNADELSLAGPDGPFLELVENLLVDGIQHFQLLSREGVEDDSPDYADMFRRRSFDRRTSVRCQQHQGAAAVVGRIFPLHEATLFHSPDVMGQPAALPVHPTGQLGDPDPACRLIGQPRQNIEIL